MPLFKTYRELLRWLQTLSDSQLDAPIRASGGHDLAGQPEYVFLAEIPDGTDDSIRD